MPSRRATPARVRAPAQRASPPAVSPPTSTSSPPPTVDPLRSCACDTLRYLPAIMNRKPRRVFARVMVIQAITLLGLWLLQAAYGSG